VLDDIAERYVRLVLAIGQHDPDYVDAYYGNPEWRPSGAPRPLAALLDEARRVGDELVELTLTDLGDPLTSLRLEHLDRQTAAAEARLEMLGGRHFTFDAESEQLYGSVAPHRDDDETAAVLRVLAEHLPGPGALADRYADYRDRFLVPPDRVARVFAAALDECRARTRARLALPDAETFTVEYVTDRPWSAYNWYHGGFRSVIEVNTDFPVAIDRVVDLAAHEGYPGHHVHHALMERALVAGRRWAEFSVSPLFSPQSLVAEGVANFGIELAFPDADRVAFEQAELYRMAGLDPATAPEFDAIQRLVRQLAGAENEIARRYLDGDIDRAAAIDLLAGWTLTPRARAEQRTRFFDRYRSYIITYTRGRDLVAAFIERQGGTGDRPDIGWRAFERLLSAPAGNAMLRGAPQ
jgi:hypothetical protein